MPALPITPAHRRPLPVLFATLAMLSLAACAPKPDSTPETAPAAPTATAPEATPAPAPEATPAPAETTPPAGDATAQCDAAAAQSFVGKEASETTVAEAQAAAGAKGAVRVIKPGQPVTMDYRFDRLNVEVDERNAIVRITCG